MTTHDAEKLRIAVEYANKLLGRNVSVEWGEKAITADFSLGMSQA